MALILTLMLGSLVAALASALTMAAMTETLIAGTHRQGTALFYAADAAAEFAIGEISRADWAAFAPEVVVPLFAGSFSDLIGDSRDAASPRIVVWARDDTPFNEPLGSRLMTIGATASGVGRTQRTVTMAVRFMRDDENVRIRRISWENSN